MSALALNSLRNYTFFDTRTNTSLKIQSSEEQEYVNKCHIINTLTKESLMLLKNKKAENLNDTSSNNISIAYTNNNWQVVCLDQDGIYALGIKKELDYLIEQQTEIDDILFSLFEKIEDYLIEQKYEICNALFRFINLSDYNEIVLIGILTATLPWKKHLLGRQTFYQNVKEKIDSTYSTEEAIQLLCGLE